MHDRRLATLTRSLLLPTLAACVNLGPPDKPAEEEREDITLPPAPEGPWNGFLYTMRGTGGRLSTDGTPEEWEPYPAWGMGAFRVEPVETLGPFGGALLADEGCETTAAASLSPYDDMGREVVAEAGGTEAIFAAEEWDDGMEYWWMPIMEAPHDFETPGTAFSLVDGDGAIEIPEELEPDLAAVHAWLETGVLELAWTPSGQPGARIEVSLWDDAGGYARCWYDDDGAATFDQTFAEGMTDGQLNVGRWTVGAVDHPRLGHVQIAAWHGYGAGLVLE